MIPIQINKSFAEEHYNDIKDNLLHHINRVLNDGGIRKSPKGKATYWINYSPLLQSELENFRDNPDLYLKPLIIKPIDSFEDYLIDLYLNKTDFIENTSDDYKILYNIFISSTYENTLFNKSKFVSRINIDTCPYCNRNYIYTSKKNQKVKPEIDHFYPKHLYPILGISYFNLIPSCEPCNGQGAKHNNDPFSIRILSPYVIKHNDFKLTHRINNIAIINPLSGKSDVDVHFVPNSLIRPNLKTFNLEELYEFHHDHAIELIIKKRLKYSKKYRDYLSSYSGLKFNKSEIDRMILGSYSLEKEQHKRPLSKLYQDIGKELGLIK